MIPQEAEKNTPENGGTRRRFLVAGGGALLGMGFGASTVATLLKGISPEEQMRQRMKARYERTGRIDDADGLRTLCVLHERAELARSDDASVPPEQECQEEIEQFIDRVHRDFIRRLMQLPAERQADIVSMKLLHLLKLSFEEQYPRPIAYNEASASIFHVLRGTFQCRGSSRLFSLCAKRFLEPMLEENSKLVEVYSSGNKDIPHVQPGILTDDGVVYVVEMTTMGPNGTCKGHAKQPPPNIRVVALDDVLAQELLQLERTPSPIIDTVRRKLARRGKSRTFSSPYAFGDGKEQGGNRPMPRLTAEEAKEMEAEAHMVQNLMTTVGRTLPETSKYVEYLQIMHAAYKDMQRKAGNPTLYNILSRSQIDQLLGDVRQCRAAAEEHYRNSGMRTLGFRIAEAAGVEHASETRSLVEEEEFLKETEVNTLKLGLDFWEKELEKEDEKRRIKQAFERHAAAVDPIRRIFAKMDMIERSVFEEWLRRRPPEALEFTEEKQPTTPAPALPPSGTHRLWKH